MKRNQWKDSIIFFPSHTLFVEHSHETWRGCMASFVSSKISVPPPSSNTGEGGGVNSGLTVTAKWETFAVLVCARLNKKTNLKIRDEAAQEFFTSNAFIPSKPRKKCITDSQHQRHQQFFPGVGNIQRQNQKVMKESGELHYGSNTCSQH